MKAIILAAGYATRLYPLTQNQPKPLLPVGDQPILNHILEKVQDVEEINEVCIVTNDKFHTQFVEWNKQNKNRCIVLNDGTRENDRRLGAIGDILFAVSKQKFLEDVLILAGDNLFDFSLKDFVSSFYRKGTSVACFELSNKEDGKRFGVIELDDNGRIKRFLEKPQNPPTNLISMGIYGYTHGDLEKMKQFLKEGGNPDAPGHFLEWLAVRQPVYGCVIEGLWLDIGDLNSYQQANTFYQKR